MQGRSSQIDVILGATTILEGAPGRSTRRNRVTEWDLNSHTVDQEVITLPLHHNAV